MYLTQKKLRNKIAEPAKGWQAGRFIRPGHNKMKNNQKYIEFLWLVFLFILFIMSIQMVKDGSLGEKISSLGIWAPVIFILLKISTLVLAPLGGTPLYLIAGNLFGSFNGYLFTLIGDIVGSTICFVLSRTYGNKIIVKLVGSNFLEKITNSMKVLENTKSFVKARILMFAMPEVLAYASGLTNIKFSVFSIINSMFYVISNFVLVFFGYYFINFASKHAITTYTLALIISIISLWWLYKDHRNITRVEGM